MAENKIIIFGQIYQIVVISLLFVNTDYRIAYILLFLGGTSFFKDILFYVYLLESVPDRFKIYVTSYRTSLNTLIWNIQLSLYFYFGGKDWRYAYGGSVIALIISIFLSCFIPESPKYLYAKKDWSNLHQILRKFASINRITNVFTDEMKINHHRTVQNSDHTQDDVLDQDQDKAEYSVLNELRNSRVLINLVIVVIWFSITTFNYHMIGFYMKYIGGNIYLNIIISTLADTIGSVWISFIQKLFGTKQSLMMWYMFACLFIAPLIFKLETIQIAVSVFLAKFFIWGTFMLSYFSAPEMFDPLFVAFAFSLCNIGSRVMSVMAPQIVEIRPRQVPIFVFLFFAGIAFISLIFLKKPQSRVLN